jgi:hypothetical protein
MEGPKNEQTTAMENKAINGLAFRNAKSSSV